VPIAATPSLSGEIERLRALLADPGLHGVRSASFYLTLSYKARPGGEITG